MHATAMNQPVTERMAYDEKMSALSVRVVDNPLHESLPPRGFSSFVLKGHQEDELNNGDPPDLMLWGEE